MKILHYSDHPDLRFIDLYHQCDILVTTGDLSYFDFPGLAELQSRKPAFGVYGNHDSGRYLEELGITNLHLDIISFQGYLWGGFQGCLRYKPGDMQYTEQEAELFAEKFPYVDVLLLHAPPFDLLDGKDPVHIGSRAIRRYIEEKHPKCVFCGHLYSTAEMYIGTTKIYRGYQARLLEIP